MPPPASDGRRPEPSAGAGPDLPTRALHLFALSGFAVAQPLLDLGSRHAQFFVAHDSRPADLVALTLVLCLGLPALLFSLELIAHRLAPRAGRSLHSVLVTFLTAAICLQALRRIEGVPGLVWLLTAIVGAIAVAAAYDSFATLRAYVTWLVPAPLVFAAVFLFLSPVRGLLFPAPLPPVDVEIDADVPIVMVVFDELSLLTLMTTEQRIDADRFPHFAALARRSHWYRAATTTAELTPWAVPALLTGRYLAEEPGGLQVATARKHPRNLFTLLGRSHDLRVFESITSLCPRQLCGPTELDAAPVARHLYLLSDLAAVYPHALLPADLANELPEIGDRWRGFLDFKNVRRDRVGWQQRGRRPRIFADFLASLRQGSGPTLYFLNSYLPHVPWQYLPSGRSYGDDGGLLFVNGLSRGIWGGDEWATLQALQRYLLQLRYADRLLGDLIATLEENGLFDPSLVVVTADHGLSFRPLQPRRGVTEENVWDILRVPLFVKLPGQRDGAVNDRNAELVDVLPTIAEVLGIGEIPWPTDGVSLLDPTVPERPRKVLVKPPYTPESSIDFEAAALPSGTGAVERIARSFGASADPAGLFRVGPRADLVGRPLGELEVAGEPQGELRLEHPETYDSVDPSSGFVPARIVGEVFLPSHRHGSLELAVAVDGTVEAVTETFASHGGRARFAAMVPESALRAGRRHVEVFVLEEASSALRLIPTRSTPRPARARRILEWLQDSLSP